MCKYIINNNILTIVDANITSVANKLPLGVYTIKENNNGSLYIEKEADDIEINYTNLIETDYDKIQYLFIEYYKQNNKGAGILLDGHKGMGKSVLAKRLSKMVLKELKLPIVVLRDTFNNSKFIDIINKLGDICLFIDGLDKIFMNTPNTLLTLLDGVDTKNKNAYIFTANNTNHFHLLLGRSKRITYRLEFKYLSIKEVEDYLNKYLNKDKFKYFDTIIDNIKHLKKFTYDNLATLVEHINMTTLDVSYIFKILNIPNIKTKATFKVTELLHYDYEDGKYNKIPLNYTIIGNLVDSGVSTIVNTNSNIDLLPNEFIIGSFKIIKNHEIIIEYDKDNQDYKLKGIIYDE